MLVLDNRVVMRPSPLMVGVVAAIAMLAFVALPVPPLMVFVMAALIGVLALALGDWAASRKDLPPMLTRELPARLVKGRTAPVIYRLTGRPERRTTVSLLDELPEVLGGDLMIADIKLGKAEVKEVTRDVIPMQRGKHRSALVLILWNSRLGFFRFRTTALSGTEVVILPPALAPQRRAALGHRSLREDLGIRPRPARGESAEFESLREYVTGDDPRHIDWRATARRGRIIVRQFQTERRHSVIVAIDTGRLMSGRVDGTSKLDHAINCAIALARASTAFGDRVGFIGFDRDLTLLVKPKAGSAGVAMLVEATSSLSPSSHEPDYRVLAETLARHQRRRALVVVITDFVEGGAARDLEDYLGLLARRHCVMLVALRDRLLRELEVRDPEITRGRLFRRLALQDLAVEREATLARIARYGAQTLDLDPTDVTAPVLNRYLALRQAALL